MSPNIQSLKKVSKHQSILGLAPKRIINLINRNLFSFERLNYFGNVSDLLQIDKFPKIYFDGIHFKSVSDCFIFETVSKNIFLKLSLNFNYFEMCQIYYRLTHLQKFILTV